MHQRRIDARRRRHAHIRVTHGLQRDDQTPRRRPGDAGDHVCRDRYRDKRAARDRGERVAHPGEGRQRRHDRAEAHHARGVQHRQDRGIGAGVHGLAQRGEAAAVRQDHHHDRHEQGRRHRPDAAHRRQGGRSETRLFEEPGLEPRQHHEAHGEVDHDHHEHRQGRQPDGHAVLGVAAVLDLCRVEVAGGGGALAHELRLCFGGAARFKPEGLAGATRGGRDTAEPPNAET